MVVVQLMDRYKIVSTLGMIVCDVQQRVSIPIMGYYSYNLIYHRISSTKYRQVTNINLDADDTDCDQLWTTENQGDVAWWFFTRAQGMVIQLRVGNTPSLEYRWPEGDHDSRGSESSTNHAWLSPELVNLAMEGAGSFNSWLSIEGESYWWVGVAMISHRYFKIGVPR